MTRRRQVSTRRLLPLLAASCFVAIACDGQPAETPHLSPTATLSAPASTAAVVTDTTAAATPTTAATTSAPAAGSASASGSAATPGTASVSASATEKGVRWSLGDVSDDADLRKHCEQRIYPTPSPGQRMRHISWWSFVSRLPAKTLTARFLKKKGNLGFTASAGGGARWDHEGSNGAQSFVIITPVATAYKPNINCKPVPSGTRTVVIISFH